MTVNGWIPQPDGPTRPEEGGLVDASSTETLVGVCAPSDPGYPNFPTMPNGTLAPFENLLRQSSQTFAKANVDCDLFGMPEVTTWFSELDTSNPVRLYATADVVQNCDRVRPTEDDYWDDIAHDNVLIGDVLWTNNRERLSEAGPAVHIESGFEDAASGFYSRLTAELDAPPAQREPLPNAWAIRYFGANDNSLDTSIQVWKGRVGANPGLADRIDLETSVLAVGCDSYTVYVWDEDENVVTGLEGGCGFGGCWSPVLANLLPLATQSVSIDNFQSPSGGKGWMLLVWPPSNHADARYQTWVGARYSAFGAFSAHLDAFPVGNANCFPDQVLPNLGIGLAGRAIAVPVD